MNRMLFLFLVYAGWVIAHYIASHLYVKLCVPATLIGFITSPFTATSTQCVGLRWIINTGGNNICMMWVVFGIWIAEKISVKFS